MQSNREMQMVYVMRRALGLVAGIVLSTTALAGDYYSSVPYLPTVKINSEGTGATPVDMVYGKEYSHTDPNLNEVGDPNLDNVNDYNAFGSDDPLQVVSWDGIAGRIIGGSGSVDAFDYGSNTAFNFPTGQVDALANHQDLLLKQVVRNEASLLFSVTGDTGVPGDTNGAHVHWEAPVGPTSGFGVGHGIWIGMETVTPSINHHGVGDLDALEVWGTEPPSHDIQNGPDLKVTEGYVDGPTPTADATRFSLDRDAATGVSVFAYEPASNISGPSVAAWIQHSDIVAAIEELFLFPKYGVGAHFGDATVRLIDVDATMARDLEDPNSTAEVGWTPGDELLFSIDPIAEARGFDAAGNPFSETNLIDGGEIMHLVKTGAGDGHEFQDISFLNHGGHLWNTDFEVAATFGYDFEDVDALEAVGVLEGTDISTPEPGTMVLCGLALLAAGGRCLGNRRQA